MGSGVKWFTADTHFGHEKAMRYAGRPFDSIEAHDEALIDNWNRVVGPHDLVYHLGDFMLPIEHGRAVEILDALNGEIRFCLGNHDSWSKLGAALVVARGLDASRQIEHVMYVRHGEHRFWLSHYRHAVWKGSQRGVFHVYGHEHGEGPKVGAWNRAMDVGVDAVARLNMNSFGQVFGAAYAPIRADEVVALLEAQPSTIHHVCPDCRGERHVLLGEEEVVGYVTADMASDAGEPDMEGMPMPMGSQPVYGPCAKCEDRGRPALAV